MSLVPINIPMAAQWRNALSSGDLSFLVSAYGTAARAQERRALIIQVLDAFVTRFGDQPVRVVRCPGRINLRGMHVDTHGGYLNLMTHQREVVVVSGLVGESQSSFVNVDPAFSEITLDVSRWKAHAAFAGPWSQFITNVDVHRHVASQRGHWSNYVEGSLLRAQHGCPDVSFGGLVAAVGSDVPRGASLSSSTALSLAVCKSALAWHGVDYTPESLIPAAQDIEWFTGARIGTSDQSAMLLPRANELINFAPRADESLSEMRRVQFPGELWVLVIDSHTERSLSGAEQIEYTRNRFAYSLALEILRHVMREQGVPAAFVDRCNYLSDFAGPLLAEVGGSLALFEWLNRIPETMSLTALRTQYALPQLDGLYARYFGPLPESERPTQFSIRGPLLFGIAESERARLFVERIAAGAFEEAGDSMTVGHAGDRRFDNTGDRWSFPADNKTLRQFRGEPIEGVPGAYGASSRALDALVDCALDAGALGASLTGAGIAGTVLALCTIDSANAIAECLRNYISGPEYCAISGHDAGFSAAVARDSVVFNSSPAAASELTLEI